MLALLASVIVFVYGVLPGMVFRAIFSAFLPLRSFERTRSDEIRYSVLVCVTPFLVALAMVRIVPGSSQWPLPMRDTPEQRMTDYRLIFDASVSDNIFDTERNSFWDAVDRTFRRQGRFLSWYYLLVIGEALLLGWTSRHMPRSPRWQRLAQKLIVPNISAWHVLLTRWVYPGATRIAASILTHDDHLYRGTIASHTADADGRLTGVYLEDAERFDRHGYVRLKERGSEPKPADFWKPIVGDRLLIRGDAIQTLNVMPEASIEIALEPLQGRPSLGTLQAEVGLPAAPGQP